MATLTQTRHTLLNLASQIDPKGQIAGVAEILSEDNEINLDAVYIEANDTHSHKGTQRTSLPSGTWRKLNDGVANEKGDTRTVIESIGELQARSEIDKTFIDTNPNPARYRANEDIAFVEGLGQTFASTVFYGNAATTPEKFNGLATRLDTINTTNVLSGSGTGSDLTSAYVVQWGMNKTHFIYPKGSATGGLMVEDLGQETVSGSTANTTFQAMVTLYTQRVGLFVHDDRCIARYANIETSGSSNTFNEDILIRLINGMPRRGAGSVIYVNGTLMTQIDIRAKDKTNVHYTSGEIFGMPVTFFRGHPLRMSEAILDTEDAIS